ncbi:glyoxalase [Paraburkholderia panacisoli]|uniref:Glyoxalase n=1 Tax=Paraburkholderia panacisoli TaxID=2603818 RepID=A0A5B0G5J5_9BURK|nr:VOC family protein [Paraburkholderia panacisoli]KAA0998813.1 glyoxalase [Paraburkholderia panacisoli]
MNTLQQCTPARLHHLQIVSERPETMVEFYQRMLDLRIVEMRADSTVLAGPARAMIIRRSGGGSEPHYGYAMTDASALEALKQQLSGHDLSYEMINDPLFASGAIVITDPQGRRLAFGVPVQSDDYTGPPARLQHTVFQTTDLDNVVRFYVEKVGFTISDEVIDADGTIMVVFMRSDGEHHTLAFFRGSSNEWDHHCYETSEWNDIRDWGDRFAAAEVPIFFGPGRHGPGNNLFFMVTDPDGNRLEFSAELERVPADKPPGVWPQSERTLNSWGRAWIRS